MDLEEILAAKFLETCKMNQIVIDFPEFENKKYQRNYTNIIAEILASNPVEDNTNYHTITTYDVIYITYEILSNLIGHVITKEEYNKIVKIIGPSNDPMVMNGYYVNTTVFTEQDERLENVEKIIIPQLNKTASIVCLVHEIFHYLEDCLRRRLYYNYRYMETLSQVGEACCSHFLEKCGIEEQMLDKIRQIRLDSLKFQQQQLKEIKKFLTMYPGAREEKNIKQALIYERCRDHAYLCGFINQVILFNRYLEDEELFKTKLQEVYSKENSLPDFLNYYGVDIKDNKITNQVVDVIRKYR